MADYRKRRRRHSSGIPASLRYALAILARYEDPERFRSGRESGVHGSTLAALERRGLAETRSGPGFDRGHVGRLTLDGRLAGLEVRLHEWLDRRDAAPYGSEEKRAAAAKAAELAQRLRETEQAKGASLVEARS